MDFPFQQRNVVQNIKCSVAFLHGHFNMQRNSFRIFFNVPLFPPCLSNCLTCSDAPHFPTLRAYFAVIFYPRGEKREIDVGNVGFSAPWHPTSLPFLQIDPSCIFPEKKEGERKSILIEKAASPASLSIERKRRRRRRMAGLSGIITSVQPLLLSPLLLLVFRSWDSVYYLVRDLTNIIEENSNIFRTAY